MAAKRGGSGSYLFPRGVTSVEDMPADLVAAIDHAHRIIMWQENLAEDEMPPRWMWPLEWELERHFEEVDQLRKAKYGSAEDREEVDMDKNEDPDLKARFGKR